MSEQYDGNMMAQTIIRLRDQVAKLKAERDRAHRACEQISVRLHAAQTERDALLEALRQAVEYDGGEDDLFRACCHENTWNAHDSDCWVLRAKAAIDAAKEKP